MDTSGTNADTALLGRAAGGDSGALAELHARHGALAQRMAMRVLRDPALAEDAVQEAFLDLWRNAARFDAARARVSTWLCVLVHRRAVDIARREARRSFHDSSEPLPEEGTATTEELVLLRYEQRRVRAAVAKLSDPQRRVIELAYFGGLTQQQLADQLDVPIGTVKSRTFDALRRLAEIVTPTAAVAEAE
jgi:RNA polymerase sigma-70 factor (ECF subfamily)